MRGRLAIGTPLVVLLVGVAAPGMRSATAASPPRGGTAFVVHPASQPVYGTKPPSADPAAQTHYVTAADGVQIWVETWLPAPKHGHIPPAHVPTILNMTPYVAEGQLRYPWIADFFTSRGYAFSENHVRGTGNSGGCLEQTALHEPDDGSRVIEYLGRDAPWADGNVGMFGKSYDAETQTAVAGLGDPVRNRYLKAMIPVASVGGEYEYVYFDGVRLVGNAELTTGSYLLDSIQTESPTAPQKNADRFPCQPQYAYESALTGDYTQYWKDHEIRPGAYHITTPTLWVHGLADWNVKPIAESAFYDRIPASTPHKAVFGVWEHAYPDSHTVEPDWARADWLPMVVAWYDRYLRGIPTGVEAWPAVQVQASDGVWRAEPQWPTTGGPVGQLALGPDGTLGATSPSGSTTYSQLSGYDGADAQVTVPDFGTPATFTTAPVASPLHLTGQAELDLWFQLALPDANLAVRLEALGASGQLLPHAFDYGYRSATHLDPLVDRAFVQDHTTLPPTGVPLHTQVRMHPTDIVVPAGGRLRLVFAGSVAGSQPLAGDVTLLHDCAHPSALRFLMPTPDAQQLNVELVSDKGRAPVDLALLPLHSDGGGLATAPVCGHRPVRDDVLGPASTTAVAAGGPEAVAGDSGRPLAPVLPNTVTATPSSWPLVVGAIAVAGALARRRRRGRPWRANGA